MTQFPGSNYFFFRVLITDAATLQEYSILRFCPGMKITLTCRQWGRSGIYRVTPPVFAVRNGDNGEIEIIRLDDSRYEILPGKLRTGFIPSQNFYLVLQITMEDNDKQFACLNEDDVDYVEDYFFGDHTTIVVSACSNEGNSPEVFHQHVVLTCAYISFSFFLSFFFFNVISLNL